MLGGIFAYFVAHCFISVYEVKKITVLTQMHSCLDDFKIQVQINFQMAIDTVFLCFCEDSEMNDGLEKPYYMSKGLMVMGHSRL